jgi:hypothetical protein
MLRILTASSILALAAIPAIAQDAGTTTPPPATEMPEPTEPSSAPGPVAEPAPAPAPADASATPAPADPSAAPAPAAAAQDRSARVAKVVEAEFPIYDANKTGDLEQPEFNKWVLALHAASNDPNAKAMDEATKTKWATDAFAAADADKNKKISKIEISKFLMG